MSNFEEFPGEDVDVKPSLLRAGAFYMVALSYAKEGRDDLASIWMARSVHAAAAGFGFDKVVPEPSAAWDIDLPDAPPWKDQEAGDDEA